MEEDVRGCEGEVGDDADGLPFAVARLRRRPEQRVDRVLTEGGKQTVAHLITSIFDREYSDNC